MWHAWSERWPRSRGAAAPRPRGLCRGRDGTPQASSVSQTTPAGTAPPAPTARVTPPAPTASARPSGPTTSLFFGDSYIVGGGYTGPKNSMGAIAARRLGWQYQIRGGGGTGFVSGNPDYGIPAFLGQIRAGALDVGPVDWLVIEGGGNDKNDDPGLVTRRAVKTLKAAAKRHPEARLVLVGTMDPTVDSFADTDGVIGALAAAAARARDPLHQRAALAGGPARRWWGRTTTTRRRRATESAGASWRERCGPWAS